MKETIFHILVSMKTPGGVENIGKFYVGDNRRTALGVFDQLKGNPEVDEKAILTLDLVETANNLPVNIKSFGFS
jgi:hypothetical protein